jgi:hypothetical protein
MAKNTVRGVYNLNNRLAVHEAGHAIVLDDNGFPPDNFYCEPMIGIEYRCPEEILRQVALAGPAAEMLIYDIYHDSTSKHDLDWLGHRTRRGVSISDELRRELETSIDYLEGHKAKLQRLASNFLDLSLESSVKTPKGVYVPIGHLF